MGSKIHLQMVPGLQYDDSTDDFFFHFMTVWKQHASRANCILSCCLFLGVVPHPHEAGQWATVPKQPRGKEGKPLLLYNVPCG